MDGMGIVEKEILRFTILHGEIQEDKTYVSHSVGCPFCGNKTRLVHGSWRQVAQSGSPPENA